MEAAAEPTSTTLHYDIIDVTKKRVVATVSEGKEPVQLGQAELGGDASPGAVRFSVEERKLVVERIGSSVVRVRLREASIPQILQRAGDKVAIDDVSDASVSAVSSKWLRLRRRLTKAGPPQPKPLDDAIVVIPALGASSTPEQRESWKDSLRRATGALVTTARPTTGITGAAPSDPVKAVEVYQKALGASDRQRLIIMVGDDVKVEKLQRWWGPSPLPPQRWSSGATTPLECGTGNSDGDGDTSATAATSAGTKDGAASHVTAQYHTPGFITACLHKPREVPPPEAHLWQGRCDSAPRGILTRALLGSAVHELPALQRATSDGDGGGEAGGGADEHSWVEESLRGGHAHVGYGGAAPPRSGERAFSAEPPRESSAHTFGLSRQNGPLSVPGPRMAAEELAAYYAQGDDASRWGADVAQPPAACPWSREQLLMANKALLRLCPWLVLTAPPADARSGAGNGSGASAEAVAGSALSSDDDSESEGDRSSDGSSGLAPRSASQPTSAGSAAHGSAPPHRRRRGSTGSLLSDEEVGAAGAGSGFASMFGSESARANPYGASLGPPRNTQITRWLKTLLRAAPYTEATAADASIASKRLEALVGALEHLSFDVDSSAQVRGIPGLGGSALAMIDEILMTGVLPRAQRIERDPLIQTCLIFDDVLWVGPTTARKLYASGMRSIDDLRSPAGQALLSHPQRVGVRYFEELRTRTPRDICAEVERFLQRVVADILPGSLCVIGGSYRRGEPSSNDFDAILCVPPGYGTCDLLPELYRRLTACGFLTDDLGGSWMPLVKGGGGELRDDPRVGNHPPSDWDARACLG